MVEFASNVHLEDRRHGIEGNIRDITELDQRAGDTARDPSQEDGMTEDEAGTGKADV